MKFGSSVADIFVIKHTQFGYDAFGFDVSIVRCLRLQFFSWTQCITLQTTPTDATPTLTLSFIAQLRLRSRKG